MSAFTIGGGMRYRLRTKADHYKRRPGHAEHADYSIIRCHRSYACIQGKWEHQSPDEYLQFV